jgi:hypothetical protein
MAWVVRQLVRSVQFSPVACKLLKFGHKSWFLRAKWVTYHANMCKTTLISKMSAKVTEMDPIT